MWVENVIFCRLHARITINRPVIVHQFESDIDTCNESVVTWEPCKLGGPSQELPTTSAPPSQQFVSLWHNLKKQIIMRISCDVTMSRPLHEIGPSLRQVPASNKDCGCHHWLTWAPQWAGKPSANVWGIPTSPVNCHSKALPCTLLTKQTAYTKLHSACLLPEEQITPWPAYSPNHNPVKHLWDVLVALIES